MCWWNDEKEGERERERERERQTEAQTEFFQAHTHTHAFTCGRAQNGNFEVEQQQCPFSKTPK
jgi:hypothetical protein